MITLAKIENRILRRWTLRQIIDCLGKGAALTILTGALLLFSSLAIEKLVGQLDVRAQQTASRIAKYIYSVGDLWIYHNSRLADLIELPGTDKRVYRQSIYQGDTMTPVVEESVQVAWPVLHVDRPIIVKDKVVGFVRIETSALPLLQRGIWIIIISFLIGALANVCLAVFPLKALDRTLQELARERQILKQLGERFALALDSMVQGLGLFDEKGQPLVINGKLKSMLALPGLEADYNPDFVTLSASVGLSDDARAALLATAAVASDESHCHRLEHRLACGRILLTTLRVLPGTGVLVVIEDVSQERTAQAKVEFLAHNDPLTGLANRARFGSELEAAIERSHEAQRVVVYCLDLDRFKAVNDTLGHAAGDALLKQVAGRIKASIRGSDVVARLGGDEFAILQADISSDDNSDAVAERLVRALEAPFDIDGHRIQIGTSIGIAIAPQNATTASDLLKLADIALYQAKANGRNTYCYFEAGMDERMRKRRELENDLRLAVTNREFELHYQPLFDLATNSIVGCEALMRWRHATRGLVSPADFIPLAEETGLIKKIGAWALAQACTDAAAWPEQMFVAVNLSAVQFAGNDLVGDVKTALAITGLAAERLELEITESIILHDTEAILTTLRALKDLGAKISMDDFGTGYSSLGYLQKFPFDKIKIDRAFIDGIDEKADSRAIVRAITSMSKSLGMATTGEGVETSRELECLRSEGCTQAQGYLISRPIPVAGLAKLFDSTPHTRQAA